MLLSKIHGIFCEVQFWKLCLYANNPIHIQGNCKIRHKCSAQGWGPNRVVEASVAESQGRVNRRSWKGGSSSRDSGTLEWARIEIPCCLEIPQDEILILRTDIGSSLFADILGSLRGHRWLILDAIVRKLRDLVRKQGYGVSLLDPLLPLKITVLEDHSAVLVNVMWFIWVMQWRQVRDSRHRILHVPSKRGARLRCCFLGARQILCMSLSKFIRGTEIWEWAWPENKE